MIDRYTAFGSVIAGDITAGPGYGYTGKKYDPVTEQYDYGFRDYAPAMARFSTVDPIRDGANWYAYCNADPVNSVDLWGLSASDAALDKKVAEKAESFVGTKYLLGGNTPSNEKGGKGIDCSETALLAGEKASGINLKDRTADEMIKDPNLLRDGSGQAGSLNFYDEDGDGTYDHVTVVTDNNKEVHPSSNKGTIMLVEQGSLDSYFQTKVNKEFNWDYIKGRN